ncbi:hypothetical protein AK812_SmicGene42677 [Symbiodinium microadriaticum]|uniref:Uncharacterized protein n=1 Tax=Symbiodinium microadriaticum TaxID=2951 RepID=A0A1Q9C2X8_SYMMI|nr:hypothetical protein AK812_SmicGene42677 [Symbiodinium microadriaticum]
MKVVVVVLVVAVLVVAAAVVVVVVVLVVLVVAVVVVAVVAGSGAGAGGHGTTSDDARDEGGDAGNASPVTTRMTVAKWSQNAKSEYSIEIEEEEIVAFALWV